MPESFVPPQGVPAGQKVVVYGLPVGIPNKSRTQVNVKTPTILKYACELRFTILDMQGATPFTPSEVVDEKFETLSFGGKISVKVVTPTQIKGSAKTSAFKVDPVVVVLKGGSSMQVQ